MTTTAPYLAAIRTIFPPISMTPNRTASDVESEVSAQESSASDIAEPDTPPPQKPGTSLKSTPTNPETEQKDTICLCHSRRQSVDLERMIKCDIRDCNNRDFHLRCVGLVDHLPRRLMWFCPQCRKDDKVVCRTNGISMGQAGEDLAKYVWAQDEGLRKDLEQSMMNRPHTEMLAGRLREAPREVRRRVDVSEGRRKSRRLHERREMRHARVVESDADDDEGEDADAMDVEDPANDGATVATPPHMKRAAVVRRSDRAPTWGQFAWTSEFPSKRRKASAPDNEIEHVSPRSQMPTSRKEFKPDHFHDTPMYPDLDVSPSDIDEDTEVETFSEVERNPLKTAESRRKRARKLPGSADDEMAAENNNRLKRYLTEQRQGLEKRRRGRNES